MAGEARTNIELGKVGDKIIFENDAIRVWTLSVPPGGLKRMHRHDLPYLIVPMTGGRVELTTIDGHVRYGEDKKGEAFSSFPPAKPTSCAISTITPTTMCWSN
jgi:hypothetical protein